MAINENGNEDVNNTRGTSPAVSSLHDEQARQRSSEGKLQEGLEDTFPASDPVSHTATTTAGASGSSSERENDAVAPKVDEALAAINSRADTSSSENEMDEIRAMHAELGRISESAQELVSASGRITRTEVRSLKRTIVREVRRHPLQAIGLAALVGYVWGMTR